MRCPRTLLPAASSGGENVPRPPLPGDTVTMPPGDPAFPGKAHVVEPLPGMLIEPGRGEHGQHALAVTGVDGLLASDRIHSAIRQCGSHNGKVTRAHPQGALAGVDVSGEIGIAVHAAVAVEEVGDTPITVVGRRLRLVDVIVHHQSPPGEL